MTLITGFRAARAHLLSALAVLAVAGFASAAQAQQLTNTTFNGPYIGIDAGYATASVGNGSASIAPDGGALGIHGGYNWSTQGFLVGVEGDFSFLNADTRFDVAGGSLTSKLKWVSSIRGRVGLPIGSALPYATAGIAFGDTSLDITGFGKGSTTETGFVYGGGVDFVVTETWTGRVEALHYDFGSTNYIPGLSSVDVNATVVRAGISYQFR